MRVGENATEDRWAYRSKCNLSAKVRAYRRVGQECRGSEKGQRKNKKAPGAAGAFLPKKISQIAAIPLEPATHHVVGQIEKGLPLLAVRKYSYNFV